jgi:hypothetical protein
MNDLMRDIENFLKKTNVVFSAFMCYIFLRLCNSSELPEGRFVCFIHNFNVTADLFGFIIRGDRQGV